MEPKLKMVFLDHFTPLGTQRVRRLAEVKKMQYFAPFDWLLLSKVKISAVFRL